MGTDRSLSIGLCLPLTPSSVFLFVAFAIAIAIAIRGRQGSERRSWRRE